MDSLRLSDLKHKLENMVYEYVRQEMPLGLEIGTQLDKLPVEKKNSSRILLHSANFRPSGNNALWRSVVSTLPGWLPCGCKTFASTSNAQCRVTAPGWYFLNIKYHWLNTLRQLAVASESDMLSCTILPQLCLAYPDALLGKRTWPMDAVAFQNSLARGLPKRQGRSPEMLTRTTTCIKTR